MSAFDDEFGLFGEESADSERSSRLGAREIADSGSRRRNDGRTSRTPERRGGGRREPRPPEDPVASARRAAGLLEFLAKRLVTKPDGVSVELFADEDGKPVIELIVDPEDLGKVIGRNGRVAQALRTIVRATAESRISVDILDSEEAAESDEGDGG